MNRRTRPLLLLLPAISLLAAGCGGGDDASDVPEFTTTTFATTEVSGDVKVFAESSLTGVFTALGQAFEKDNPGAKVVANFNFAASPALVQQVSGGAPADVFVADEANMVTVISAGKVGDAVPIARNSPSLLVQKGNPKGITGPADLAKPGVTFAMCAPEAACGALGASVLGAAGVSAPPTSREADTAAVVSRVTGGEVDAGIVYVSDVKAAGDRAQGVPIDIGADVSRQVIYQIAVTTGVQNREAADAWVKFVRSDDALQVFGEYGFGGP